MDLNSKIQVLVVEDQVIQVVVIQVIQIQIQQEKANLCHLLQVQHYSLTKVHYLLYVLI